jgi:hypothetical protein
MAAYDVSFFKKLLSSDGHSFKCLQQRIVVDDVPSNRVCVESVRSALRMSMEAPRGFDRGRSFRPSRVLVSPGLSQPSVGTNDLSSASDDALLLAVSCAHRRHAPLPRFGAAHP